MAELTPAGNIDPNSFTPDELLKHIYRQLQEMNAKMEQRERDYADFKKHQDVRIDKNKESIIEIKAIITEKEKAFKTYLTIMTVGMTAVSMIIGILAYFIK